MIAIVDILLRDKPTGKRIGIELGRGTPEVCKARIPKELRFVAWNQDSNEDLPIKVLKGI